MIIDEASTLIVHPLVLYTYGYVVRRLVIITIIIITNNNNNGTSDSQLTGLINMVKMVSDDIKMELGLDKCAKATFKRGKKVSSENIPLMDNIVIQEL